MAQRLQAESLTLGKSGPSSTGPWTTLGITAGPTFTTTVASATYFQCIVTCPNGAGFIATTPTMYAQMASFYTCYCLSQSETNFEEQNIGNVSLFNSQNVATEMEQLPHY